MLGKVFSIVIAFGLFFNLLGDLTVYHQSQIETGTRHSVQRTYEMIRALDSATIEIKESQINGREAEGLRPSLAHLRGLLSEYPERKASLDALDALPSSSFSDPNDATALILLRSLGQVEKALLGERLQSDELSNRNTLYQIVATNIVDLTLMLVVFGFFFYERRQSIRMQKAMSSALAHVESVNNSLMKRMSKRDSKFKMTVHDLKNPLGSIRGFAELMQSEPDNTLSTIEMVQIIKRISNNTLTLVESVLDEDEDEHEEMEDVKVLACLRETCAFLEAIAHGKKQTIVLSADQPDFILHASRQRIQDIFYNIVSNALKYSPAGSEVFVDCEQSGRFFSVAVRDQGPGFQSEDFPRLFLPGEKLSARPTDGEHSSGIGLYSVKRAVDAIRGRVEIKNHDAGGALVTVKFPFPLSNTSS